MRRRVGGLFLATLLAAILTGVVFAIDGITWIGATAKVNLSNSQDVLDRSALALGPIRVAAVWAGDRTTLGTFMTEKQGGEWVTSSLALTDPQETWYSVLAYSGTQVIAVWVQGASRGLPNQPRAVMQRDVGGIQAQTVITPIFGDVNPSLVVGPTGMHMVFAATTSSTTVSITDLYYTHRYFTQTTWASPTVVVTHAQAIPLGAPPSAALIWSPRIGLGNNGTTLHIVWEQEHRYAGGVFTSTIWYVEGLWNSGNIVWTPVQQVSPADKRYSVRPNLAIGNNNKVHISWSELWPGSGTSIDPDAQYIHCLQLGNPAPTEIGGGAIEVNNNKPTWATSSIAVNGKNLCVAWHGFYTGDKEEIIMRCSQDEGASWGPLVNVSESPTLLSLFPTVKVDGAGQAHVAWVEFELVGSTFTNADLYYRAGSASVTGIFLPLVMRGW